MRPIPLRKHAPRGMKQKRKIRWRDSRISGSLSLPSGVALTVRFRESLNIAPLRAAYEYDGLWRRTLRFVILGRTIPPAILNNKHPQPSVQTGEGRRETRHGR